MRLPLGRQGGHCHLNWLRLCKGPQPSAVAASTKMMVGKEASALFWEDRWLDSRSISEISLSFFYWSQGALGSGGPSGMPWLTWDGFQTSEGPWVPWPYGSTSRSGGWCRQCSCLPLRASSYSIGLQTPSTCPRAAMTPFSSECSVHTLGGLSWSCGLFRGSIHVACPARTVVGSLSALCDATYNTRWVACYVTSLRRRWPISSLATPFGTRCGLGCSPGSDRRLATQPRGWASWTLPSCCHLIQTSARKGASSAIMMVAWCIWKHHNTIIFDNAQLNLDRLLDMIKSEENGRECLRRCLRQRQCLASSASCCITGCALLRACTNSSFYKCIKTQGLCVFSKNDLLLYFTPYIAIICLEENSPLSSSSSFSAFFASKQLPISSKASENSA